MSENIGHGSKLQLGNGAGPEVFADTAGVLSIEFGSNKVDTLDTTDMGTAGSIRSFIGGLENPGDVTVKLNVKPGDASQTALRAAKDGLPHNFKVINPSATETAAFSGIITSIDKSVPDDKIPTLTVKVQISGAVTYS